MLSKVFKFIKAKQAGIVLIISVFLISFSSFNLGKIAVLKSFKTPIKITDSLPLDNTSSNVGKYTNQQRGQGSKEVKPAITPKNQPVVASKKSRSKLYHFGWCPGASKIAAENLISFPTEAAAITAGYTLARNCSF